MTWDHVDLDGHPCASPAVPPHVAVWRSVRTGGDTKTRKSRRTLALPKRRVDALRELRDRQDGEHAAAGPRWHDNDLVFTTRYGTPLSPENVRRDFRKAIKNASGVNAGEWTPATCDTASSHYYPTAAETELIYRKQIRHQGVGWV